MCTPGLTTLASKVAAYVDRVKKEVAQGVRVAAGPWQHPGDPLQAAIIINAQREKDGERNIDAKEALNLVLRPTMFLWAPDEIYPGTQLKCPVCGSTTSRKWWGDQRVLHGISTQSLYVSRRHACDICKPNTFLADSEAAMALLPLPVQSAWNFSNMGRVLCDAPLADLLRSSATKSSWSSTTDTINELKATAWTRDVTLRYLRLCAFLQIAPVSMPTTHPAQHKLSSEWARNLYLFDFRTREKQVLRELEAETGDTVLKLDWTTHAAARCRANFLLNVMTGENKVLASVPTATSAPNEAEHVLWQLRGRGVRPKVAYVDDECCGAWAAIVGRVWPGCFVRLDALHAIMRLTKTTVSTQHPWHGQFCGMVSEALFTYDKCALQRLDKAMARQRRSRAPTKALKCKYVPRVIQDAEGIAHAIEEIIERFERKVHADKGTLLTPGTRCAWAHLRGHILRGCVCDPPGINLNIPDATEPLQIGGETYYRIRKLRGTSSLEGYHSHQKRWLGPLGRHAPDAAMALLSDGNLRWNRNRSNENLPEDERTPPIFAHGLLEEARHLHQRLCSKTAHPNLRSLPSIKSAGASEDRVGMHEQGGCG